MSNVACHFCGVRGERAKEHIWPLWLQEFLGTTEDEVFETHYALTGSPVDHRKQSMNSLVSGGICRRCNNGWMSSMERSAAAVLRPLLQKPSLAGEPITAKQATDLSLWAFKTAIVRNLGTNYRRVVPPWHYRHLFKHRRLPKHVVVDAAVAPSHVGLSGLQSQTLFGIVRVVDQHRIHNVQRWIYNIVLGIGPLLLRVIHLPLPGYRVFSGVSGADIAVRLSEGISCALPTVFVNGLLDLESEAHYQYGQIEVS